MVIVTEININGEEFVAYSHNHGVIVNRLDCDYSVLISRTDMDTLYIQAFKLYGLEIRGDGKGIVNSSNSIYNLELLKAVSVYKYIGY